MVDQRAHAATDGTPVAARLVGTGGPRARSTDDRSIRPGYSGQRRYRMAFYFSYTRTVLQRVINHAVGRVRRVALMPIALVASFHAPSVCPVRRRAILMRPIPIDILERGVTKSRRK